MAETWDVVVVGSCMIDLVCFAPRLPKNGETLRGSKFVCGFGGKGCNQCVAVKKLGGRSLLVAKIGSDSFGKNYLDKILEYGIPEKFIKITKEASTGTAQITVADTGENQIVIVPGANDLLAKEDVVEASEAIADCKVLVCQLEIPESITMEALRIKRRGKTGKSILNAAPARANLDPMLFSLPDVFCVNETEAETLIGSAVVGVDAAKEAIKELLRKGCNEVIVTLGELGSVYGKRDSEEYVFAPAFPTNAVDTTGAGDAFVGTVAFLLATRPELSMRSVLEKANRVAAVSVQRKGTQESFPFIDELPKELGNSPKVPEELKRILKNQTVPKKIIFAFSTNQVK